MCPQNHNTFHILHVVPGLGPGGMELALARVVTGLTSNNMHHSIACLKGENEITDRLPQQTQIHYFHARPNEPQLPFRLARLVRKIRPDVIHARNWGAWPDIALGRLFAWPIVPLALSFHGLGKAGYMPLRRRMASYLMARTATCLFTVSEESKRLLTAKWGWPEGKVDVIPNGLDTSVFCPPDRSSKGDKSSRIVVGTVGNLRPVKNHALLVRACGELVKRGIDLELHIAGEGEERSGLLELAQSLDFTDRLQLPGRVEDIPGFLHGLDIFVLSSDSEQHPNALNEAMACGIACIATQVGCVPEMLDDGRCGRIISPGDIDGLVAALTELVSNQTLRQQFSQAARQQVCAKYSIEQMLQSYDNMYRRLAGRKGKGA